MIAVADELWDITDSDQEAIEVVVRNQLPLAEATDRLLAAIQTCWPGPIPQHPREFAVSATALGPAMWINGHGDPDFRPALGPIADALPAAGIIDARLESLTLEDPELVCAPRPTPFIECRFAVRDDVRVVDLVEPLVQWCLALPEQRTRAYLSAGMLGSAVPEADAVEVLSVNARIEADTSLTDLVWPKPKLIVEANGAFRMVTLSSLSGYISIADGTVSPARFDWRKSLNAITPVMADAHDWAEQAFVKRGGAWSATADRTLDQWVPVQRPIPWLGEKQRELERTHLLDAFGVMLLSADKRPVLPQTGRWAIEPAGTALLVQHVNPAAWYGDALPDATTLSEAREDLRPLLRP